MAYLFESFDFGNKELFLLEKAQRDEPIVFGAVEKDLVIIGVDFRIQFYLYIVMRSVVLPHDVTYGNLRFLPVFFDIIVEAIANIASVLRLIAG